MGKIGITKRFRKMLIRIVMKNATMNFTGGSVVKTL